MNREKRKQQLLASGLALLLVASLVTSVSLIATQPARAQTPINSCTTITASGEYILTQDIMDSPEDPCIDIQADNVVLDGNGHTIDGVDGPVTTGVQIQSQTNVTAKNLTVTDWGQGIRLFNSDNNVLTDITATNNDDGISLGNSNNNTLTNNTATNNTEGIDFFQSDNNTLTNNTAANNTDYGIVLGNSNNNTLTNNTATNNSQGISLGKSEFDLFFADNNTLINNTITANADAGIILHALAADNLIYNNLLNNTQNVEFFAFANNSNTWNVSNQSGPNIIGGPNLGGNYYATPNGDGFSQTCTDANNDGFCDQPYDFGVDNNNTDFLPLTQVNGQQQPDITVSPTSLNFGKITVGDSKTKNVTVTNTGTGALNVSSTDIVGADASVYSIVNSNAPFSLAPGESQNVTIEFAPTSKSTKTATLQIESNDPDEPTTTVELCGKAVKESKTVFPHPLVIKKHGKILFKIGPPQDLNGDGLYEDVNGDDKFTFRDVVALAIVENAYQHDHLDLNSRQVAALDFNHDGKLTQKDVVALAIDLFKEKTGWHSQLKGSDLNKDGTLTARDRTLGQALLNGRDLVKMLSVNGC